MVKVEIQTTSEKQKDEIRASVSASGTIVSGSGKFSSVIEKISKGKSINIQVYGNIPETFIDNVSAEQIDKLLLDFPKRRKDNFSIVEFSTIAIDEIPALAKFEDIFDLEELQKRKVFIRTLDALHEDLIDWTIDINYVLSDYNRNEFTKETIDLASADLKKCNSFIEELVSFRSKAERFWLTNGENGNKFDLKIFDKFPKEFPIYERVVTIQPPKPQPKPKPKKRRSEPIRTAYGH